MKKPFKIVIIEDNEDDYKLIYDAINTALFNADKNYEATTYGEFSEIANQLIPENLDAIKLREWINSIEEAYTIKGFIIDISLFSGGADKAGLTIRDFIRDGDIYSASDTFKSTNIPILIMTSNDNPDMQSEICKKNTKWIIKSPSAILGAGMTELDRAIAEHETKLTQGEIQMSSTINNTFNGDMKNFQQGNHNAMINQEHISQLEDQDIENIKNECENLLKQISNEKAENFQLLADLHNLRTATNEKQIDKKNIFEKAESLANTIKNIKDSETLSLVKDTGKTILTMLGMSVG